MLLLGFHIFAISLLIGISGSIGYYIGQQHGIKNTKSYYEQKNKET